MKMKLLLTVVFACTLLTTSYAQINKGTVWLGSNFSFYQQKDRPKQQLVDRDRRTVRVLPAVGIAIKENLVLGIFGQYSYERIEDDGYFKDVKSNIYGGGLFARRYIPVFKGFYIYGEGRLGYNSFKSDSYWVYGNQTSRTKPKGWSTTLTFTPGITYGITKNIQLEAGFASLFDASYKTSRSNNEPNTYKTKTNIFSAGVNLENSSAFTIGVRFLINKKA